MLGWWWNNNQNEDTDIQPPKTSQHEPKQPPPSSQAESTPVPIARPTSQPRSAGSQSASARIDQLNRDDSALEELKAAFASLSDPSSTSSPTSPTSTEQPEPDSAHNTSLYPATLSCSQCFDAAYYCSSIGGQLNSVYRYGGLRSCSDLWAQWRFCMRTKTMGEEERRRRIWEWNREKEARRRVGRSSEEVWSLRTEGPPEGALGLWYERGEDGVLGGGEEGEGT